MNLVNVCLRDFDVASSLEHVMALLGFLTKPMPSKGTENLFAEKTCVRHRNHLTDIHLELPEVLKCLSPILRH